jgi:hypothetical protein
VRAIVHRLDPTVPVYAICVSATLGRFTPTIPKKTRTHGTNGTVNIRDVVLPSLGGAFSECPLRSAPEPRG